jgi:SAM-dependent methyltransferase
MTMDAHAWDDRYKATDSVWSPKPNVFVTEYLANLPVGRMVDVAGGEGRHALWFAQRGWEAENFDFSAVGVSKSMELAEELHVSDRFHGHVADADSAQNFFLAPADLVVIAYLQIPASGLAAAIANAARQLVAGGTLFGVWHARENLAEGVGGPQDPAVLPTIDELSTAFSATHLVVDEIGLRRRGVTVDGDAREAVDVVVMARSPEMVASS